MNIAKNPDSADSNYTSEDEKEAEKEVEEYTGLEIILCNRFGAICYCCS